MLVVNQSVEVQAIFHCFSIFRRAAGVIIWTKQNLSQLFWTFKAIFPILCWERRAFNLLKIFGSNARNNDGIYWRQSCKSECTGGGDATALQAWWQRIHRLIARCVPNVHYHGVACRPGRSHRHCMHPFWPIVDASHRYQLPEALTAVA